MGAGTRAFLIAVAVMLLLFIIGFQYHLRTSAQEPRTYVMQLDTAAIVGILFEDHAMPSNDLRLFRRGAGWERDAQLVDSLRPTAQASQLLQRFQRLPVKRVMGMILLLGERYELTETTLCKITFIDAEGVTSTLELGSSTFAPGAVGAWTYVRIPDRPEVYAVEGLLTQGLRRDPATLRP